MKFFSRKLVKPQDLNSRGTLFGKYMSEINFVNSAKNGDIVEIGLEVTGVGKTSVTIRCMVRNKITQEEIIRIEKIVFVHVNDLGRPSPHGLVHEV